MTSEVPTAPMTVVVLNDFCYVQGGASKVAIQEACSLARAGQDVVFLGAVGPVGAELRDSSVRTICLDQPELLDVVKHPLVALQGMWNRAAEAATASLLATLDPARTVVHLHGYTKALSTSPLRAARRGGFRVLCTLHDFFAACPNGAFFNYQTSQPCALRPLSAACIRTNCDKRRHAHKLFRVARSATQRIGGFPRDVHRYITLSRRSGEILRPYLPANARFTPLPNATELLKQPPVEVARNQLLVHVGRLDEEKGVRQLAEAAERAGRPLLMVGDGPLRPALEGRAGITVTGWVSASEVQVHLAAARCLAFPSLWYETYGLVVAEAAARGVPAIVSDISAAAERVRDGVTGWHTQAGDVPDLTAAIRRLDDDAAVTAAGAAAYADFWAAPPTEAAHVEGLLAIYRQALTEDRVPGTAEPSRTKLTMASAPQ